MDDSRTSTDDGTQRSGFSFGFSKKQEQKQLSKSAVGEVIETEGEELDYVLSLEGKKIKSSKDSKTKSAKHEYIIPLLKRNNWRGAASENKVDIASHENKIDDGPGAHESLDELAAKEILIETKRYNEDWDDRGKSDDSIAIPLLMQNKIPEGFESDERLDVSLRPDIPDDADYEQIPIEHFGMAMLRGMGWTKDRGVGKNGKTIAPIEAHLRPKGLGLGADRNNSGPDKNVPSKEGDNKEELELKKNAYCVVIGGVHKGLYGTVEGIDEDNARIMLKLTLSGKVVNIIQCNVSVVGKKEYEKYSKYLNKEKADSFKEQEERNLKNGSPRENGDNKHKKKKSHKRQASPVSDETDSISLSHKSKKTSRSDKYDSQGTRHQKEKNSSTSNNINHVKSHKKFESSYSGDDSRANSDPPWLRNDLRVRMIDKAFHNGKYYKEKVVIVDVPAPGWCVCRTEDHKVISDVPQSCLETVIPRADDAHVAIVSGSDIGQIGRVMKRDKEQCIAIVQLLSDRNVVLRLQYDEICEYVGDVHERDDF